MNRAFLAAGLAFLAVGIASSTVAGGLVWSTFFTLGLVFIALAFALGRGDENQREVDPEGTAGKSVDEDA